MMMMFMYLCCMTVYGYISACILFTFRLVYNKHNVYICVDCLIVHQLRMNKVHFNFRNIFNAKKQYLF